MIMFQEATRKKLRFDSPQGSLTVEDLWDIPLHSQNNKVANLDDIAKALFKQIKEQDTESFVFKKATVNELVQLKFEIVKHIIGIRLTEVQAAEQIRINKDKKQQILAIIAAKENEQLMGTSLDELKKMAESL